MQARKSMFHGISSGKYQDRQAWIHSPGNSEQLHTVEIGKAQVQYQRIVSGLSLCNLRLGGGVNMMRGDAVRSKTGHNPFADQIVVFYQKYPHSSLNLCKQGIC
ncbi:hypothetical protein LMG26686_00987 [Achromobacter mucicolens]|nr:hypothetical protein LMG26686_00987 [Achromobacter mucicolens]